MNGSRWKTGLASGLGAGLVATGLLLTGNGTSQARASDLNLTYLCAFPLGDKDVAVRIQGTFPQSVMTGTTIAPDDVAVSVTVPRSGIYFPPETHLRGTAQLTTDVVRNGVPTPTDWPGLTIPETPIQQQGDTLLAASGPVAGVQAESPGEVGFNAGNVMLDLIPSTSEQERFTVYCSPKPDQDTRFATVRVVSPSPTGTGSPTPTSTPTPKPYGCFVLPSKPPDERQACAVFTGFANVKKLDAALAINDEKFQEASPIGIVFQTVGLDIVAKFKFARPLKVRATFLTFGFVPVTATIELHQEGIGDLRSTGLDYQRVTGSLNVSIRLTDVTLNGSPLEVGERCRTTEPTTLHLSEVPGQPFRDILNDLRKAIHSKPFTIPPFTSCVAGTEDLTPLFNAAVAGLRNYLKITLGKIITADLKPPVPKPFR